ncbi:hypothetical protein [Aeromicrobium marinum]|uniref:hypothetical protein n=1 Tax=Aeromicrobium marinum TaxID=219314 RepID=UPI00058E8AF8|nr:hypothetical protein [Aeromicrobium marinum]
MIRHVRTLGLLVPALLLAGCGGISPGAAAVVEGQRIAMSDVDDAAVAVCLLNAGPDGAVDGADARRQAVSTYVLLEVARNLAAEQDLRIAANDRQVTAEQRRELAELAGDDVEVEVVVEVVEANREILAIADALGARETGLRPGDTTDPEQIDQIRQAGSAVISDAVAAADVEFDPRFNLDTGGALVGPSGGLAAASGDPVDPAALPATQRCA